MKTETPIRVLHLEDNDHDAELVRRTLTDDDLKLEVTRVMKRETFVNALEDGAFDLILSDYSMPGFDGGRALALAREKCPDTPFVFVSGTLGEEAAVQSLKNGAANYVLKGRLNQLPPAIRTTLQEAAQRKHSQDSLKALQQRANLFQRISETVTDLVCVLDLHGRRLYTSHSYQTLFGPEPLHGTDAFADIHPEDRERIRDIFKETVRTGVGQDAEFRFLLKDGTIRYVESHGGVIRDVEGRISNIIVVSRDVTKRKCAEENLKASEERFRSVIQTANDAIVLADTVGNIAAWNSAAQRMFGYSEAEVQGKPLTILLAERYRNGQEPGLAILPDARSVQRSAFSPLGQGPAFFSFIAVAVELHGLRKDGTEFPLEISLSTWKRGADSFYSAVFRDITERKQLDQQLRNQAALIEHATDAICVIDMEARITYWNKSAESLYGWSTSEAVGEQAHDLLFKTRPEQSNEAFRTLIEKSEWEGEMHQVTRAGKEIIVHSRWTMMHDSEGTAKSILVINSDITEKKKLEAQFLRAQRLESVGRLAGGIAHDLNNVLAPILLCAQMLGPKLQEQNDKKMIETIEASARRGAEMVSQLLSFSRGGLERLRGKPGRVELKTLLEEQVKMARQTFPQNIEIRAHIPKKLSPIIGDSTQLFQVLMNLCVNARDAMPNGGTLELQAEEVVIDREYVRLHPDAKVGPHVALTVSDTGTGIPPEIIESIFNPGFTTKPNGKGTGLGLATVMTIVKNHHGHIQLHSEVGKGTCFKIFLPASEEQGASTQVPHPADVPQGHGEWILVVDDEQSIREILTTTLEHFGYRVLDASDGTEAMARYTKYKDRIALVVADMVMPFMNGSALIRALKRLEPGVKILGITGRIEDEQLASVAEKMGVTLLEKPISSEKLLQHIHQLLATSEKRN